MPLCLLAGYDGAQHCVRHGVRRDGHNKRFRAFPRPMFLHHAKSLFRGDYSTSISKEECLHGTVRTQLKKTSAATRLPRASHSGEIALPCRGGLM